LIKVTRINGAKLFINAVLIETIEETPDTILTLTTGKKIIVLEKASDVVSLVKTYMRNIGTLQFAIKSHTAEEAEDY
jgi:flagellar protein FlbD